MAQCFAQHAAGLREKAIVKPSATGFSRDRGPKVMPGKPNGKVPEEVRELTPLHYDGPAVTLGPSEGAWLPVRLKHAVKLGLMACVSSFMVIPVADSIEVATGVWDGQQMSGMVFGANLDLLDASSSRRCYWCY